MGQKYLSTKTKAKVFDITRDSNNFSAKKRGKLGTPQNPANLIVQTKERRNELSALFEENGWRCQIKVDAKLPENIADLTLLQNTGITKVNAINIGRNDPCYCGSGKKYKKCCIIKEL